MKTIIRIAKTELMTLFFSPVAWLVLLIFAFQVGYEFIDNFADIIKTQNLGYRLYNATSRVFTGYSTFLSLQNNLYLYVPLLTMGLMSRELGSGSIKLLFSSPINTYKILIGKYIAMLVYSLSFVIIILIPVVFADFRMIELQLPTVFAGILGVYLIVCTYAAIGLFISCLTKYQVVAAFGTLGVLALLSAVGGWWGDVPGLREITYWLSINGRTKNLLSGLICSEDILYFFVVSSLFVGFSIIKIKSLVIERNVKLLVTKYIGLFLVVMFMGYITSRPIMKSYKDVTYTKSNTLVKQSQEIMNKISDNVSITTYCNILDSDFHTGSPRSYKHDTERFEKYVRFKPKMQLNYVYYWDKCDNPELKKYYAGMTDEEIARKKCENSSLDFEDLLNPEQIKKKIDLSAEGNKFVRVITTENGLKGYLRLYNDMQRHPYESEITAAFKRLVVKAPKVGFIQGHGERVIDRNRDKDYSAFVNNRSFRQSLMNQGFDSENIELEKVEDISKDYDIIVIADVRTNLSESSLKKIDDYIERGGNMIVLTDVGRQKVINPLLKKLDLELLPGEVMQPVVNVMPNVVGANIVAENVKPLARQWYVMSYYKYKLIMDGAAALGTLKDDEVKFKQTPIVVSDAKSWREFDSFDAEELAATFNPERGEVKEQSVLAMALSRKVNKKEQKIIVLGDADCISNGELSRKRTGINGQNFSFIPGMFSWLTDGEYPINIRRERPPDNAVKFERGSLKYLKIFFLGIVPLLLIVLGGGFLIRRKRR